ncbi:hypothetical protein WQQ_30810 [Hydrocarboniphaga effusa AP103]|uniref:Uncharacterized protein n=1 Tax=Hydrocarboniphaga effusa AP103 TaxID=1172194 RepID=I7ZCC5_9GAMM|nr:hypothetical protein WQQ_30810 [Hydrocarboniphaga effusa AP103]
MIRRRLRHASSSSCLRLPLRIAGKATVKHTVGITGASDETLVTGGEPAL